MSRSLTIACHSALFILSALSLSACLVRANPQGGYYQQQQPVYYNRPAYYRPAPVVYAQPAPVVYVR